jgi:hypothetical protein
MGDWWDTVSFNFATRFLENMGYTWKFAQKEPWAKSHEEIILLTPSIQDYRKVIDNRLHGYMILNKDATDKDAFVSIFENNGWQPTEKEISHHGPRAGNVDEVDSVGYHIATIWEIKKDNGELSTGMRKITESMEAEIMGDLGKGNNMRIYIWSGYMAFYPDGYSNMTLIEWFNDNDLQSLKPHGEVYFGENAFTKLKELRTRLPTVGFYPSINRVSIT